ncbi:MAG TPA: BON domain-containing protein [Pyrinomonadaceae bacterium]|nr:BON domain-containing protein [Pyrinomonadaceae bacterium]
MLLVTDTQIKEDLLRELRHSIKSGATGIEVSVCDYVVTLSGSVENPADRSLAQEVAKAVEGIHDVINHIEVKRPATTRTDEEIMKAVRHALEWDALIPDTVIQSSVSNGWVGLEGTVRLSREREDAERIVRRLAGVRGVYNEIIVNSDEVRAENVHDVIKAELRRRADQEARNIKVLTRDDAVIISGRVQSWEERCAIVSAARRAPGVGIVKDHLSFEQGF